MPRRTAQKKATKIYDVPVRRLVARLQEDPRKADFVGLMRKDGAGLVGATSEEEANGLWVA